MLRRLDIYNVRNLRRVRLDNLSQANFLYGPNGSGKTSVLESIHLLSTGRSFRSITARPVISNDAGDLTVYGGLAVDSGDGVQALGVRRDRAGAADIRVGGVPVRSAAYLAAELPVLVLNSDSFELLVGAPRERRRFLDWGVFHVEHSFFASWQRFQRGVKQRNALLRRGNINESELRSWTTEVAAAGDALTASRKRYFHRLQARFAEVLETVLPDAEPVTLRFRQGWDRERTYLEALQSGLMVDKEQGFTHTGPQRADIRIAVGDRLAADILSRGQQKLVVSALKLAQGHVHAEANRAGDCVFLLDDLPSELDEWHLRLVCDEITRMGVQVFISCIDLSVLRKVWCPSGSIAVFHVEHGEVAKE